MPARKAQQVLGLLALISIASIAAAESPDPRFFPEEEADFVGAGNFLCQEALGLRFELPPPGFKVNKEAQARLVKTLREPGPSAYGWVWLNEDKGQLIVLEMVKGPRTAKDFLFFAGKVEEGFANATGFELEAKEEQTERAPYELEIKALINKSNAFDLRCVSTPSGHRDPSVACMVTFSPDHETLGAIRKSLSFAGCE